MQAKKHSNNKVYISFFLYLCPKYHINSGNISEYLYKSIRNTEAYKIKQRSSNNSEENGLSNLTARELKDICRIRDQSACSNKDGIITRLAQFLSALSNIDTDADSHFEEEDTK